ncbi:hypothetical protein SAMN05421767_1223 [Granulicatella balaenopterae]|uniref:Uncharacterized protein n=1 Tax=Granulicatella balaenopterae TaxID=137733 RepID=A0A1H9LWB8_9LACT|nr:hypothetical protein [Granulicatella balaenopterae]SER15495.1 hypothetical protein SAMN05421767_1223 [Granulicatella balaenopterae]
MYIFRYITNLQETDKYCKFKRVLDELFLSDEGTDWTKKVDLVLRKMSIKNKDMFTVYFSLTDNIETDMFIRTKDFIENFNQELCYEDRKQLFNKWMYRDDFINENILGEFLYLNLYKVIDKHTLLKVMWDNIGKVYDNSPIRKNHFFSETIAILLDTLNFEEFCGFVNNNYDYKKAAHIYAVVGELNAMSTVDEGTSCLQKSNYLEQKAMEMSEDIFNNRINIFDEAYYMVQNLSWLFKYNIDKKDQCAEYIRFLLKEDNRNIFKILYEAVECRESNNDVYNYKINYNSVDLVINNDVLDEAMSKVEPQTENDQIIYELYQLYKVNKNNVDMSSTTPHVSSKHLLKY